MSRKRDRSNDSVNSGRLPGRPKKGEPPRVPYEELDRILVFGEVVTCEDGESTTIHYPSYRDLARRYGVSNSVIARYAKEHDCQRRREVAKGRVAAKADQKLVELRANSLAVGKDEQVRIIDEYLAAFEKALSEGRVRCDNPSDFNLLCRLREFVLGGADSRQEVHASLSLDVIQERHRQLLKVRQEATSATRGEVSDGGARGSGSNPPALPAAAGSGNATGHMVVDSVVTSETGHFSGPHERPSAALNHGEQDAEGVERARQGANVAPTGAPHRDAGDEDAS